MGSVRPLAREHASRLDSESYYLKLLEVISRSYVCGEA